MTPSTLALPLIRLAFASTATPGQTLALWDHVIGCNSTEVLAVAAAACLIESAPALCVAPDTTSREVHAILTRCVKTMEHGPVGALSRLLQRAEPASAE